MKKEDISGIIVYLLILAIAIVFGVTVLREHAANSGMDTLAYIFFILGAIAAGLVFNAILFEIAHISGAKAGRYTILSVNILGLLWYRDGDKTKFRFKGYDGLTGETRILPRNDLEKESNPSPYLLFGTLFYLVELVAIIVVFTLFKDNKGPLMNMSYFFLVIPPITAMTRKK